MSDVPSVTTTANEFANLEPKIQESLIATGDLKDLTPPQRVAYYMGVCKSIGLNPFTQPFMYVALNGKLQLYARRDATDQLRRLYNLNTVIKEKKITAEFASVTVTVTSPLGRSDEATGIVSIVGLKAQEQANAIMKAETKAKRRAALSYCGLGFMDEDEITSVKGAKIYTVLEMQDSLPKPTEKIEAQ